MKFIITSILFLIAFNAKAHDIYTLNSDTTITGTWNLSGKILRLNAKVSGTGTITNAIIEASPFKQIFDTTITIGTNVQMERFSAMWYGASSSVLDNSTQLQKSIDASINRPYWLYIPSGSYRYSQPLMVILGTYGAYQQAKIKMYGEATFWDNGYGSTQLIYDGDSCALGLQLNKGSIIKDLIITGKWVSPGGSTKEYYNLTEENYTNQGTAGNGWGIWIDPIGNWSQRSGSTGVTIENVKVEKFNTLIQISNSISQNGEIILLKDIQLGDGKYGIVGVQPQEKENHITGLRSWGKLHTVIKISNGNYYIDGMNVAGSNINLFNIQSGGWFPTYITNVYAENIGSIGSFSSNLIAQVSNSVFDFADTSKAGVQTLLTTTTPNTVFNSCMFRYYGFSYPLKMSGNGTFFNCFFTGAVTGLNSRTRIYFANGEMNIGASILQKVTDTITSSPVKFTIKNNQP